VHLHLLCRPGKSFCFIASRLIALGKHPGVRPIGIGEVIRHIIGKVILTVVSDDIQMSAGSQQLCAGQKAGCEAAVHAMRNVFEDPATEGVLLVDASNAFNNLNCEVALHNILLRCPPLTTVITHIGMTSNFTLMVKPFI
jgi:hypothetical protein